MSTLKSGIKLLLCGSEGHIQKEITIKWYQKLTTVRGIATVWGLDNYDRLVKGQEEACTPYKADLNINIFLTIQADANYEVQCPVLFVIETTN